MPPDAVLVVNAGSSSLKFSAFTPADGRDPILVFKGQIEGIGTRPCFIARDAGGEALAETTYEAKEVSGHDAAIGVVSSWLRGMTGRARLTAVGHRVAHGGMDFDAPVLIDDDVIERLEEVVPLVPLHQPANLAAIRAVRVRQPHLPQVACFDTAFHRGHPELADRYALPETLYREGVRRYGFHGLSYEYIARALPAVAPEIASGRVIVAHLGSGASMCAMKAGHSLDSTMGFSALDGLPMGTRCGEIDPGVLLYLMRHKRMSTDEIEQLLYKQCGLRGLSGISNDVRDLLVSGAPAAKRALDYFVYHACRQLGTLAAVLGGLDGVIFTAGIGEHSPDLRARICHAAGWLGISLDEEANRSGGPRITKCGSHVSAWVIPTDEEMTIARHTLELVRPPHSAMTG